MRQASLHLPYFRNPLWTSRQAHINCTDTVDRLDRQFGKNRTFKRKKSRARLVRSPRIGPARARRQLREVDTAHVLDKVDPLLASVRAVRARELRLDAALVLLVLDERLVVQVAAAALATTK